jgi:diguanylate cyclase (GGDEF)-like protein
MRPVYQLGRPYEPAAPCLVVILGPDLGRKIPIAEPELVIGRDEDADLMVPVDGVSRVHCQLSVRDGMVWLRDLGSTNGTWVNGGELQEGQEFVLRSGDRIELVGVVFKFLDGGDVEAQYHEEIYQLSITDGLTRVFNRRYLMDFLTREISRCRRHERALSLVLVDVDHFKSINDRHGHAAGDQVLREVATLLGKDVRREECLARFGGDEFALVMPETGAAGALVVADRIRSRVERHAFSWSGQGIEVTISLGVAELGKAGDGAEALVAEADAQLYAAKAAGRNAAAG